VGFPVELYSIIFSIRWFFHFSAENLQQGRNGSCAPT